MTGAGTAPSVAADLPPADDRNEGAAHDGGWRRAIGTKVAVIARQLRQRFDARVEAMGITRAKFLLVAMVARNPGVTQRVIAQKLEVTDVTAGRLIDRVCADGLIERRANPDDRRAYCIYTTPAAQPLLDALAVTVAVFEQDLFEGFAADEIETLDRLLARLANNVQAMRGDPPPRYGISVL